MGSGSGLVDIYTPGWTETTPGEWVTVTTADVTAGVPVYVQLSTTSINTSVGWTGGGDPPPYQDCNVTLDLTLTRRVPV